MIKSLVLAVKNDAGNVSKGKYVTTLVNNVYTNAVIDSGNTAGTCISYRFATKIGLTLADLDKCYTTFGTAKKGNRLTVYGKTLRPIKLQFEGTARPFFVKPYVVEQLQSDLNVSLDFLERHHIDQIHSAQCLLVDGKRIRFRNAAGFLLHICENKKAEIQGGQVKTNAEVNENETARSTSAECYIAYDTNIPPNSAKYVWVNVPKIVRGFMPTSDGICTAEKSFIERNDVHPVTNAAVRVDKRGRFRVPVLNTLDTEINVTKGQRFGTFTQHVFKVVKKKMVPLEWPDEKIIEQFNLKEAAAIKSKQDMDKIVKFIKKFGGLFSENDGDFGETEVVQHDIFTEKGEPVRHKCRPLNPEMENNLEKQLNTWLEQDIIEEANSPWSSRLLPVPKKDGRIRWCVDYRALNKVTVKDSFPLPNIEESLSRMSKCKVFSGMDGTGAYHVVKINSEHREKTAFSCHKGQFQFKRMPFGLCNAPSTYARLVSKVLEGLDRKFVANYLDDTCVFSKDLDDHIEQLEKVFRAHWDAGIKLAPAKCQFFREEIEFLGHVVSKDGIKTSPKNIEKILNWEVKTLSDVHTFVGKCVYYSNYIPNFAKRIAPLQALLTKENLKHKKKEFILAAEEIAAVEDMKEALTNAPVLAYPDFTSKEPFILDTDWSHTPGSIGGVLSQVQDGQEKVIAYGAKKLKASEKNYSSNKGELLAVIHFMEKWKFYLWPREFVLRTDHRALRWIYSMEAPSSLCIRWLNIISHYRFKVEFRAGKDHGNADALSRANISEIIANIEKMREVAKELDSKLLFSKKDMDEAMEKDSNFKEVFKWMEHGRPKRQHYRGKDPEILFYYDVFEQLEEIQGRLYLNWRDPFNDPIKRLCIPKQLQSKVIMKVHELGHIGMNNTTDMIKMRYAFPNISAKCEAIITTCENCQTKFGKPKAQKAELASTADGMPWQRVSIDLVGPFKQLSSKGNKYILTAKCCFTKWIEAVAIPNKKAETVGKTLFDNIFSRMGMPQQLHSDQGKEFMDQSFNFMCRSLGILHTTTPSYNPQSNQVERSHRHLRACLKALENADGDWEDHLPTALMGMRTCVHKTTNMTPFKAMFGREAQLPIDVITGAPPELYEAETIENWARKIEARMNKIYEHIRDNTDKAIKRSESRYTQPSLNSFKPGEKVWLYTPAIDKKKGSKLTIPWTGPWLVQEKVSNILYNIITTGTWSKRTIATLVSVNRLKKFKEKTDVQSEDMELTASDLSWEQENEEEEEKSKTSQPNRNKYNLRRTKPINYGEYQSEMEEGTGTEKTAPSVTSRTTMGSKPYHSTILAGNWVYANTVGENPRPRNSPVTSSTIGAQDKAESAEEAKDQDEDKQHGTMDQDSKTGSEIEADKLNKQEEMTQDSGTIITQPRTQDSEARLTQPTTARCKHGKIRMKTNVKLRRSERIKETMKGLLKEAREEKKYEQSKDITTNDNRMTETSTSKRKTTEQEEDRRRLNKKIDKMQSKYRKEKINQSQLMDAMNKEMTEYYDRQLQMKRQEDNERLEKAYAILNKTQEEGKANQSQMMEAWSQDILRHYDQQLKDFRRNDERKLEIAFQQLNEKQAKENEMLQTRFQEELEKEKVKLTEEFKEYQRQQREVTHQTINNTIQHDREVQGRAMNDYVTKFQESQSQKWEEMSKQFEKETEDRIKRETLNQKTTQTRARPSSPRKRSTSRKTTTRLTLDRWKKKISPFTFPSTSTSSAASSKRQTPTPSPSRTPEPSPPTTPKENRKAENDNEEMGVRLEDELDQQIGQKRTFSQRDTSGSDNAEAMAKRQMEAFKRQPKPNPTTAEKRTFSQRDTSSSGTDAETKQARKEDEIRSEPESYVDTTSDEEKNHHLLPTDTGPDNNDTSFVPSEDDDESE